MAKGRPRIELNKKEFESLLAIQCSLEEVAAFFDNKLGGCSVDTVERWCKRTYGKTFAEIAPKKRAVGKISLRRNQFELSKKNATMAIFLGKQYLDQSDNGGKNSPSDIENNLIEILKTGSTDDMDETE